MAFRSAIPLSKRLAAEQNKLCQQGTHLASRGFASEPSVTQNPNYLAYGAGGVAAVGVIYYFFTGSSKPQNKVEKAAAKTGEAFQADGAVGKQFKADGSIGSTAQAVGGPLDKHGAIGKQFNKDGAIGGAAQEAGETVEKKAKK
ncbi:hypothetical protein WJX84_009497 [Apatococcus fuscideae]|uniref:Uncharacterized protein n=1 Tax=Apatococcus fuscideae TaxID=2026836 RepID=A0AAW1STG8_9CHLO